MRDADGNELICKQPVQQCRPRKKLKLKKLNITQNSPSQQHKFSLESSKAQNYYNCKIGHCIPNQLDNYSKLGFQQLV